ncbi:hypothetical protein [Streptococcus pluranimalium]|uniref:hypothetical protein n=1 Tax=Streptococcus pluranimalium TaxID=82348 RepID=UPI003F691A0A
MDKNFELFIKAKEYVIQHEKLTEILIAPIIVGLVLIVIPSFFSNTKKIFGKVKITNTTFINVPKTANGEELQSEDTNILENYVQAKYVIDNTRFENTLHKLVLTDVTVREYQYIDLVIQSGFDNITQIVDFFRFNNGTQQSNTQKYNVVIKYHNLTNNNTSVVENRIIEGKSLGSGDIESVLKIDVSNAEIKKYFDDSLPDFKQSIEISISSGDVQENDIVLPYLSSVGKFYRSLGGNAAPVDKPSIPIIELAEPYKKNYNYTIDRAIFEGTNYFKFNILVDKPSLITYNLVLMDSKEKTIVSHRQKEQIKIRFPKYKLVSSYKDDIYVYMKANELENSNYSEVQLRQPSLLNTIDKTKEEYNLMVR